MATIEDIAKATHLSIATVSYALRGDPRVRPKTASRVREAADALGYTVNLSARNLRAGRTGIIGFAAYELRLQQPSQLASEISDATAQHGLRTIIQQIASGDRNDMNTFQRTTSQLCDGIIITPSGISQEDLHRLSKSKPLVMLDSYASPLQYDTVRTPQQQCVSKAAHHVASIGCSRVIILGAPYTLRKEAQQHDDIGLHRVAEYIAALHDEGIEVDPRNVINIPWYSGAAAKAIHALIKEGRSFDCAICLNDELAFGAIRALADCGIRVPDDVAVIGYDGVTQAARNTPSLTTIAIDWREFARKAVDLLVSRINHTNEHDGPVALEAGYQLIIGESTRR